MRALSLRSVSFFGRGALATISTSRMWCSTEAAKKEENTAKPEGEQTPITQEAFAKLEKELEKAREDIGELKKEVLYRAAEAENARRIGRDDVEKARAYGITSFGKDMLDVVDTLEKGIDVISKLGAEEIEKNKALHSIYTGVKMSVKVLLNNFAKHGIEKLDVQVGAKFDPNIHDALLKTPPTKEIPSGHISTVLKTGYKIKDRILRAPQVGVAEDD
ncbi:co-chaperone GrpE [Trypanosoma theileri]|uniref:Co-chaperone GrpE n=1 Tax=Trypanosoma theileri TaxID=67003 RepID=A0A1X0P2B4_9TRYP|nr:co-chaperone GrpE [Trypanosoma theileri]ORC91001.1 co-chaperone GrpE [Trypanosoma theileri]